MQIKALSYGNDSWQEVSEYAQNCSWHARSSLAKQMRENYFSDWERVFVALVDGAIAGYCTLAKTDCIPDVPYTPYIGFVFVGEPYRGHRLSQTLIISALKYAKEIGFEKVYLISDHVNLYEKYGFVGIDKKLAFWGSMETIYMHLT